jgi:hypothetical protein
MNTAKVIEAIKRAMQAVRALPVPTSKADAPADPVRQEFYRQMYARRSDTE